MVHDYLVVGAGAAGCAAAARLASRPGISVLLLEAGGSDRHLLVRMPKALGLLHRDRRRLWHHPVEAQQNPPRPAESWPRGRMLGGTTSINGMVYTLGQPQDYDGWAASGLQGWGWSDVAPYFRAIEDHVLPAPGLRGKGGPMPVSLPGHLPQSCEAFLQAAAALGHPRVADLNDTPQGGVGQYFYMTRNGRRFSAADAFLRPALRSGRLKLRGGCEVLRLLTEGSRITGVEVRTRSGTERILARHVILSAGTIGSPAILMRSGIGPAADLARLGIAAVADVPAVGRGFMDHPILRATLALTAEAAAQSPDARHTNCCVTYSSGLAGGGERDMIMIGFNHRGLAEGRPSSQGAIGIALYDAFSRGEVRLASADPDANPVVEENMLDDARDRLRMRDGIRRLAAIVADPAVTGIATAITFGESGIPFADAAALPDEALDALMLAEAWDIQHAAGTCRMGAAGDPLAVVDPDLKVRGVAGLRVADASIMPTDCRANLHFTCVMIGEALARRMRA